MNQLGVGGDFDFFVFRADGEFYRDGSCLVDVQGDSLLDIFVKGLALHLQLVVTDRQFEQNVGAVMIGGGRAGKASLGLVALTAAPSTTAPLGSVTVPRMLPVICWAQTFTPINTKTRHSDFLRASIASLSDPWEGAE